jgi:putative spermidine/putrescine transport system substrate-binding protein
MKKLTQTGNIGTVGVTDTDFSTCLTSGETVLGFYREPQLTAVAKSFILVRLTKQADVQYFFIKAALQFLKKRPDLKATLDFVIFCIGPEMSTL